MKTQTCFVLWTQERGEVPEMRLYMSQEEVLAELVAEAGFRASNNGHERTARLFEQWSDADDDAQEVLERAVNYLGASAGFDVVRVPLGWSLSADV